MPATGGALYAIGRLRIAAVAALVACIGDILMLLVANGNAGAGMDPNRYLVPIGGVLGVTAIPLYYIGYRAAGDMLALCGALRTSYVFAAVLVAGFGSVTHALTAIDIWKAQLAGLEARPPAEAFADLSSPLFATAVIAAAGALVGSACLLFRLRQQDSRIRLAIALNPVVWTLILSLAAAASQLTMAYLAPTAPNLAHALFFATLARVGGTGTGSDAGREHR